MPCLGYSEANGYNEGFQGEESDPPGYYPNHSNDRRNLYEEETSEGSYNYTSSYPVEDNAWQDEPDYDGGYGEIGDTISDDSYNAAVDYPNRPQTTRARDRPPAQASASARYAHSAVQPTRTRARHSEPSFNNIRESQTNRSPGGVSVSARRYPTAGRKA